MKPEAPVTRIRKNLIPCHAVQRDFGIKEKIRKCRGVSNSYAVLRVARYGVVRPRALTASYDMRIGHRHNEATAGAQIVCLLSHDFIGEVPGEQHDVVRAAGL